MTFIKFTLAALGLAALMQGAALADGFYPQFTVTGTGRVAEAPDMATIMLGVAHQRPTAAEALEQMRQGSAAVFDSLARFEIEARDMQTSQLQLVPQWEQYKTSSGGDARKISSYLASNLLTIRVRDLNELGAILDAVTQSGANRFNGLSFGFADRAPLLDRARDAAMQDAIRKARMMAAAAGVELGRVFAIHENGGTAPRPEMLEDASAMRMAMPVAAGEVGLSVNVSITYELLNQ